MNYYELLGVERNASHAEINKAYRKKASKLHTDRDGGDNDQMVELNLARDTLLDPDKREEYDKEIDPIRKLDEEVTLGILYMFGEYIKNGSSEDPLETMRDQVRETKVDDLEQINALKVQIGKVKARSGAIKLKKDGHCLFSQSIAEVISGLERQIEAKEKEIALDDRMLERLGEYQSFVKKTANQVVWQIAVLKNDGSYGILGT